MRADPHDGPELMLHPEAEYIDAALTFVSLPTSSCDARPDHTLALQKCHSPLLNIGLCQAALGSTMAKYLQPRWGG
jgi:hypothetical protein